VVHFWDVTRFFMGETSSYPFRNPTHPFDFFATYISQVV